ncbi:MAG: hypothetical protein ACON5B_06150 [Myxococcota bacterium]
MPLMPTEIFICVLGVASWWFALTIAAELADATRRRLALSLSLALLTSSLGTTAVIVDNAVRQMLLVSRDSRALTLEHALAHVDRPMTLGIAALALFLLLLRANVIPVSSRPALGLHGACLLAATAVCLAATVVWLAGLGQFVEWHVTLAATRVAIWTSLATVLASLAYGISSPMVGSRPTGEPA